MHRAVVGAVSGIARDYTVPRQDLPQAEFEPTLRTVFAQYGFNRKYSYRKHHPERIRGTMCTIPARRRFAVIGLLTVDQRNRGWESWDRKLLSTRGSIAIMNRAP